MPTQRNTKSADGAAKSVSATLADVIVTLKQDAMIPAIRLRDLCSAVQRVAGLLGEDPARVPLDLPAISTKLASVNPIAAGIGAKTLSNVRSAFLTAVKVSGLNPVSALDQNAV
jgi:hypothetical protein